MSSQVAKSTVTLICLCLMMMPEVAGAGEYVTFDAFYNLGNNKYLLIIGAVSALMAGAAIFFTGGTASPLVISTGTWVGNMMGLSGVAATNAGLALLGGGSLAAGGYGMVGGVALISATYAFSTTVIIDYAVESTTNAYQYSKFVDNSRGLTTLPLPNHQSGSDNYESTMTQLEKVNKEAPIGNSANQNIIKSALKHLKQQQKDSSDAEEMSQDLTLEALLSFVTNDYGYARQASMNAYKLARKNELTPTLPAYIFATSSLYDRSPNMQSSIKFFKYSVLAEPTNPNTPLLFSIYLDRLMYRFNDDQMGIVELDKIYEISSRLPYDKRKAIIQQGIVTRYFSLIKLEQQKILSLSGTNNLTIKASPKTLLSVKESLWHYQHLLNSVGKHLKLSHTSLAKKSQVENSYLNQLTKKSIQEWEIDWLKQVKLHEQLLQKYLNDIPNLESKIAALEEYQALLADMRVQQNKKSNTTESPVSYTLHLWIAFAAIVIFLAGLGIYMIWNRAKDSFGHK